MTDALSLQAVFLDRDGVLNIDHGYVHDPAALDWIDGARDAVAAFTQAGLKVIVVTNQSGVGRGYFDDAAVDRFHAAMNAQLAERGGHVDAFYHCPFCEEASVERYRHPDHPDRKPNPGMVLRGLADWNLDPAACVLIGDKDRDVEAARRAGVEGLLFPGGDLLAFARARLGHRIATLVTDGD